ncbi:hypothetical protein JMJ77_0014809 [Colletotrichum scovillei]|uniref:Uncharacterized protein n=1 Tax=Colletotrichum scovillei TaxID=1209932 RepID=A0A9P7UCA4_9PEZI|nr:hypothetical protein JMJ77_0014809 [Colletotrichum scovillei]KAG7056422.1 hypothetical protein JMJ78_0000222 [Colletotrichum scovillei]KAG7066351.1 hypothetical protein JMJ76_0000214 [Colletotrichum scovillei]
MLFTDEVSLRLWALLGVESEGWERLLSGGPPRDDVVVGCIMSEILPFDTFNLSKRRHFALRGFWTLWFTGWGGGFFYSCWSTV